MKNLLSLFIFTITFQSLLAQPHTSTTSTPKQIPGTQKVHEERPLNSPLPAFHFVTSDEKFITEKDLLPGKPVILALFNPNCDHCLKAVNTIREKIEQFYNVQIVFVTSILNFGELKNFVQIADIARFNNIHVCATQDTYISSTFMPNWILPQIMVYNKDRKLKKIFYEEVQTDSLLYYLFK